MRALPTRSKERRQTYIIHFFQTGIFRSTTKGGGGGAHTHTKGETQGTPHTPPADRRRPPADHGQKKSAQETPARPGQVVPPAAAVGQREGAGPIRRDEHTHGTWIMRNGSCDLDHAHGICERPSSQCTGHSPVRCWKRGARQIGHLLPVTCEDKLSSQSRHIVWPGNAAGHANMAADGSTSVGDGAPGRAAVNVSKQTLHSFINQGSVGASRPVPPT